MAISSPADVYKRQHLNGSHTPVSSFRLSASVPSAFSMGLRRASTMAMTGGSSEKKVLYTCLLYTSNLPSGEFRILLFSGELKVGLLVHHLAAVGRAGKQAQCLSLIHIFLPGTGPWRHPAVCAGALAGHCILPGQVPVQKDRQRVRCEMCIRDRFWAAATSA